MTTTKPYIQKKKEAKCPECSELHEARFNKNKSRPGWDVWCPNFNVHRRVINPKYDKQ